MKLSTLVKWSASTLMDTKLGKRKIYRGSFISQDHVKTFFSQFWRTHSHDMRQRGFTTWKGKEGWSIISWHKADYNGPPSDFDISGRKQEEKEINEPEFENKIDTTTIDPTGLLPYQLPCVALGVKDLSNPNQYGILDGSDTGLGKTYVALAIARQMGYKVAVMCPKPAITVWLRVIVGHFKMSPTFVLGYEKLKAGNTRFLKWIEIQRGTKKHKKPLWTIPPKTIIIVDESHRCNGMATQNANMLIGLRAQCPANNWKIICASATPAIDPTDFRAIGYVIGLHNLEDFYPWTFRNGCAKTRFGLSFTGKQKLLHKLNKEIFQSGKGFRLRREDVPEFPESDIKAVVVDIGDEETEEAKRIYEDMNRELDELTAKEMKDSQKRINELVIRLRARQRSELIKVPAFTEMAEDAMKEGMSVIVSCNFTDTIKALCKRLKTDCVISGNEQWMKARQYNIDRFQSNSSKIVILQIQAGGVALSLHDLQGGHPRFVIISPPESATDAKQVVGRGWRSGAKTKCVQRFVYAANTIEEEVCESLKYKLNNLDSISDGDLMVPDRMFKIDPLSQLNFE